MRITQMTLCDYNRFKVSKIQEISIDIDNEIQLIIGSNGCGKSSILHELFPYPPIKSSFGKNGFKSLSLEHDGSEYRLTYDVSAGHRFFKDDINLNISGTNEIQKELIFEHFGLTNDIHTILKCALPICEMVPSVRKKILMSLNPIDVSVFLDRYQKVHKDVIAYGNNLDRLYSRQKQLMSKKIPEQQYLEMIKRKGVLDNQEKLLLMWITSVSTELNNFPILNDAVEYSGFKNRIKQLMGSLYNYRHIDRKSVSSKMTEFNVKMDMYSQELVKIENTIEKVISVINENETKKVFLEKDVNNVVQELNSLKIKFSSFNFKESFVPIGKNDLEIVNRLSTDIMNILVNITYIEYKRILSKQETHVLYQTLMNTKLELNNEKSQLEQLKKQHEDLLKSIRLYKIPTTCTGSDCELFNVYNEHQLTKQTALKDITDKLNIKMMSVDRISSTFESLSLEYTTQQSLWNNLDKIIQIISSNSYLKNRFHQDYIISRTNESPMGVYHDIIKYITESTNYHEYLIMKDKIHELELINAAVLSKKQISIETVESDIAKKKLQLEEYRSTHQHQKSTIIDISKQLNVLMNFRDKREHAHNLLNEIIVIESNMTIKLSREYLSNLLNVLSNILNSIRSELIDITNICKEQELLLARLDTEIDAVIQDIKPKFDKAKHIEKSLADLPVQYTKNFVNAIIETANYFINEVMTYSMKLLPIGEDEECTFQFPVFINDEVPTKDISLCSDGQRAIIQLAFNLAIVVELRFNNYPIFCDEYNRTLDSIHSQRLTDMLINLMKSKIATQLFVVNHDRSMIEQLSHTGNVIVLNPNNIVLPDEYNNNVKIVYN